MSEAAGQDGIGTLPKYGKNILALILGRRPRRGRRTGCPLVFINLCQVYDGTRTDGLEVVGGGGG